MKLSELPINEIRLEDMPFYFWRPNTGNTYIMCGPVKRGGNEPPGKAMLWPCVSGSLS